MTMTALTVQLPDSAVEFVRQQAAVEGFASADDYLADLVAQAQQRLEAALIEGLDSGPSRPMTRTDWDSLKQRVFNRQAAGPPQ
jgi:Arc/MetJ-type ribon-helix-helix transcriptional regulator